ncbi:MAG: 50S ribosome-binding GTPase [Planctomycetes bacterium]|nr:50S ribosome-binding GTPase [Planctomycetota bacterium]
MTLSRDCYAMLTPPGRGGVAVFALAGPGAAAFVARRFRARRAPSVGDLTVATVTDHAGHAVDQAVVAAPAGGGGVEVCLHGSPAVARAFAALLEREGFTAATEEETLALVGLAGFDAHRARALRLALAARTRAALALLLREAFPAAASSPEDAGRDSATARASASLGRWLACPPAIAVIGPPNAGKSTLANALFGRECSIVSPTPGATIDPVECWISLAGLPARLADTAGLGDDPRTAAEEEAMRLAEEVAARADLRLVVIAGAGGAPLAARFTRLAARAPVVIVLNKRDLPGFSPRAPAALGAAGAVALPVSAARGEGVEEVRHALLAALMGVSAAARLLAGGLEAIPGPLAFPDESPSARR